MGYIDEQKDGNSHILEQHPNIKRNNSSQTSSTTNQYTPIQIGLGLLIVGASAGLTLYTKKTASLISQLDKNKGPKFLSKTKNVKVKQAENGGVSDISKKSDF